MTSRDFCYWLQGFFEISDASQMEAKQVEMVKRHLNMVFVHEIDPSMGDETQQAKLNELHEPKPVEATTPTKPYRPNHHYPMIVRC